VGVQFKGGVVSNMGRLEEAIERLKRNDPTLTELE
jgi:hypothetical protein